MSGDKNGPKTIEPFDETRPIQFVRTDNGSVIVREPSIVDPTGETGELLIGVRFDGRLADLDFNLKVNAVSLMMTYINAAIAPAEYAVEQERSVIETPTKPELVALDGRKLDS